MGKELREIVTVPNLVALLTGANRGGRELLVRLEDDGSLRLWGLNIGETLAGFERAIALETDGTQREQLILWDGAAQIRALAETDGTQRQSLFGKDRSGNLEAFQIFVPRFLAEGQLAAVKGTVYTAPTGGAEAHYLHLHNTSAATTETVLIYANASGTSRIIGRATLLPNESADVLDVGDWLKLESGDLIEGQTTNAATVDFVITGKEQST